MVFHPETYFRIKLERELKMKKSGKNANPTTRAVPEDLGNKEWRFAEIPYETEMKFNDLLDARSVAMSESISAAHR